MKKIMFLFIYLHLILILFIIQPYHNNQYMWSFHINEKIYKWKSEIKIIFLLKIDVFNIIINTREILKKIQERDIRLKILKYI